MSVSYPDTLKRASALIAPARASHSSRLHEMNRQLEQQRSSTRGPDRMAIGRLMLDRDREIVHGALLQRAADKLGQADLHPAVAQDTLRSLTAERIYGLDTAQIGDLADEIGEFARRPQLQTSAPSAAQSTPKPNLGPIDPPASFSR